jgi:formylmethanofuran dehydrogenase subunit E
MEVGMQDVKIGSYSYDEYLNLLKSFHGSAAPGLLIGGFMVDLALKHLPEGEFFDAICETKACLPDALQLLTPCTVGNGWLKILNQGRFALTLFEKYHGKGVRVYVDVRKFGPWPNIREWFLKLKPKHDQDTHALLEEIRKAGTSILGMSTVVVLPENLNKKKKIKTIIAVCPACGEAYRTVSGSQNTCKACSGEIAYCVPAEQSHLNKSDALRCSVLPLEQAVGRRLMHDMTRIIPGKEKGAAFQRGQTLTANDVSCLHEMGKMHVSVEDGQQQNPDFVHEDDAALAFAGAMAGEGVSFSSKPREGKVNLTAERKGLLTVDTKRLVSFNTLSDVVCASRRSFSLVEKGQKVAGVKAIPLHLHNDKFQKALAVLQGGPLFQVRILRRAKVGILVTGTEVFQGRVEDKFIPLITRKVEHYGCEVLQTRIVPDDCGAISKAVQELVACNIDLLVTTSGLSVDPDDVTRQGLLDAGVTDVLYGMPVAPGAMTLVARLGQVQVIGVPAGALYYKTTGFDLLLPRLLAGQFPTREDLAQLGHGAFCLECEECRFPRCTFSR